MNNANIYWLFSSAAQSISVFIALLLTGYAFVRNQMETAHEKDDTLEEIHPVLRKKYHNQLKLLASMTGFAIVLSLIAVYVNGWQFQYMGWLVGITSVLDFATIVVGIFFVISMIDPQKYEKTARMIFKKKKIGFELGGGIDPAESFFMEFTELESITRQYIWDNIIPAEQKVDRFGWRTLPSALSFLYMIDILKKNNKIPPILYRELKEINQFRNLAFHGNFTTIDHSMVERVIAARSQLEHLEV
jgi:hypothetical protein